MWPSLGSVHAASPTPLAPNAPQVRPVLHSPETILSISKHKEFKPYVLKEWLSPGLEHEPYQMIPEQLLPGSKKVLQSRWVTQSWR